MKPYLYLLCLLLSGCSNLYFRDAGPPSPAPPRALAAWPWSEYWTGIIFNGDKIGFTHLRLARAQSAVEVYRIESEAALRFQFLNLGKRVNLVARDQINADLSLREFNYDYDLDGNRMRQSGTVREDGLTVRIETAAGAAHETYALTQSVYPASIINLFPVLHGLEVGARHSYLVYDGESQRLAGVEQVVVGYEESELFEGHAFKVRTRMHGTSVTTWINERGEPVLEISMNGIFIAGLESEWQAQHYLAQGALNKNETLLQFSMVHADRPIPRPRQTSVLEIELFGTEPLEAFPNDRRQRCTRADTAVHCVISRDAGAEVAEVVRDPSRYLASTIAVPRRHPVISALALEISRGAGAIPDKLKALLQWMQSNIRLEAADTFTAVDVLETRRAECQGNSFLFASFARSLGIPTRVVNGLVYSDAHPGFLYHTWVESWLGDRWQAIDPSFGQYQADATHIKLVEGENLADLAPLLSLLGRLTARILALDPG